MSISPWDLFAKLDSPDAQYVAVFDDATEIAMGAPTRGTLRLYRTGHDQPLITLPDVSSSFVWSSDSTALAFPRWTPKRDQRLGILRLPSGQVEEIGGRFDVLELESFSDSRVIGVDSPIHRPKKIDLQIPSPAAE